MQELYKFDVTYDSQEKDSWVIIIEDKTKLAAFSIDNFGTSSVTSKVNYTKEDIILENVTFEELLLTLRQEFNIIITGEGEKDSIDRYNLTLTRNNIEMLKQELISKYGISLKSGVELSEIVTINFRK